MPNGTTVRSLLWIDSEKRLYAGAFDEFGYWEAGADGRQVYTSLKSLFANSNTMTEFWGIHRIGKSLYFRTDWNIFKLENGKSDVLGISDSKIDCSAVVRGSLLVSTAKQGPMILSGDMFVPLPGAAKLVGTNVREMLPWIDGNVLIATDIRGLWIYNGSDIVPFHTRFDARLFEDQLWCADVHDQTLALGTIRGGVYILDVSDGSGTHIDHANVLQNNTVLATFFDDNGNLWLGLDNGMDYLMLDLIGNSLLSKGIGIGAGYSSLLYNGKLYLGTNQGLFYTQPAGGDPREIHSVDSGRVPVSQVWRLAEIDGTLFCSHDRGLLVMQDGRVNNIEGISGVWNVIPIGGGNDMVLGCSYDGLFVIRRSGKEWVFSHKIDGWSHSSGSFVEDREGHIWFWHWVKGLFRLTLDDEKRSVVQAEYFGTEKGLPTEQNNIPYKVGNDVIFASEQGFYLYDQRQGRMVREQKLNALFSGGRPATMRIHDLKQGDLLFTSTSFCGIAMGDDNGGYTLDSLSMRHIANELISGFDNHNMLNANELLMSTENGFSIVDLARIKRGLPRRPLHHVFIKAVSSTGRGEILASPRIPYADNSIRVEVASPEFHDRLAVEYSFMLEGHDREWSAFSRANYKEFTYLREGDYTLKVRARNLFAQSVSEAELGFSIEPPWYRSRVLLVFYFIVMLAIIWWLVRQINRKSNERVNEMQRQKELEMEEQQRQYEETVREKEKELVVLQNITLQHDLMGKSQELASSAMNIIRKNEILTKIEESIGKVIPSVSAGDPSRAVAMLRRVQKDIRENMEHDSDWEKFGSNFDIVHENYLKRLGETYPELNLSDKKLCAYLRMDLQSKEIAPLMNISARSVEMARWRLRKKMGLNRSINLTEFLQNF